MIAIMWQFDVKNGRETEFEQLYGVDGEWTVVNRQSYVVTTKADVGQGLGPA